MSSSTMLLFYLICSLQEVVSYVSIARWFGSLSSFLADRQFCVRVGQAISSTRQALFGVQQGSCLSPILFIFYTADMLPGPGDLVRPATGSYADDVMLIGLGYLSFTAVLGSCHSGNGSSTDVGSFWKYQLRRNK